MPRIAVIAVHGVGKHLPGETAKLVARQLQRASPGRYGTFQETPVTIPVGTVPLDLPATPPRRAPRASLASIAGGAGSFFRTYQTDKPASAPLDVEFSRSLLDGGQTYQATYSTIRLDATRDAGTPAATNVEVRELFWSDLSHVVGGAFAILEQLFQLLIHMASLGRTAAAFELTRRKRAVAPSRGWRMLYALELAAYWLLSMPIVIGNLMFVLLAALLVPALVPPGWLVGGIAGLAGLYAAALAGVVWLRQRGTTAAATGPAPPSAGIVLVTLVWGAVVAAGVLGLVFEIQGEWRILGEHEPTVRFQRVALALLAAPMLFFLCDLLMRRYDVVREGSLALWRVSASVLFTWMIGVAAVVWSTRAPLGTHSAALLLNWLGHVVELPFTVLSVLWSALIVCSLASVVVGLELRWLGISRGISELGTARLAATLPAPLFLVLVLAVWGAAFGYFRSQLEAKDFDVTFTPWCSFFFPGGSGNAAKFVHDLIDHSAPLFLPYVAAMVGTLFIVAWAMLPSAFLELAPLDRTTAGTPRATSALGEWLDRALHLAGGASWIPALAFFVLLPVGGVIALKNPEAVNLGSVATMELVVGAVALGFVAATRAFSKGVSSIAGKLRVPVDVALDVDNWLRERPIDRTVRLKVFARFAALLAQLPKARYDHIVIVAHSQGTVVAADFLRYLRYYGDPAFKAGLPPIRLLTMGSPLRQLYAARFEGLYGWAANGIVELEAPSHTVALWVNAYGSGDYIGRALWTAGAARWVPGGYAPPAEAPKMTEFCVGAAAHTHYFDEDNAVIGACVDALIGP